jgi:hypothetical protein
VSSLNTRLTTTESTIIVIEGGLESHTHVEADVTDLSHYETSDFTTDFAAEDLNNLTTKSHDNLDDVSADDHHSEAHSIASHDDTTATGAELDTLTDGSEANSLHVHDHGGLSGLGDDDHTIYSLADGTRDFSGTVGGITPVADADLATKLYIDDLVIPVDYVPDSVTVSTGTQDSGNVASLQTLDDADALEVSEVVGSPGFMIEIDYVSITETPTRLDLHVYYDGSLAHTVNVEIYDQVGLGWDVLGTIPNGGSDFGYLTYDIINGSKYVTGGGVVNTRINHSSNGNITHNIFIDYAAIRKIPTGGGGGVTDHGQLAGLLDDDHTQYLKDVVEDTSPTAGGDFDMGGFELVDTTGDLVLNSPSDDIIFERAGTEGMRLTGDGEAPEGVVLLVGRPTIENDNFRIDVRRDGMPAFIVIGVHSNTAADQPGLQLRCSKGTLDSPTNVEEGNRIGTNSWSAQVGGSMVVRASIRCFMRSASHARMEFQTGENTNVMTLEADGNMSLELDGATILFSGSNSIGHSGGSGDGVFIGADDTSGIWMIVGTDDVVLHDGTLTFGPTVGGGGVMTNPDASFDWSVADTMKAYAGEQLILSLDGATGGIPKLGVLGAAAVARPEITGARDVPEEAVKNLLAALATSGYITDSTTEN